VYRLCLLRDVATPPPAEKVAQMVRRAGKRTSRPERKDEVGGGCGVVGGGMAGGGLANEGGSFVEGGAAAGHLADV
jgi:hypothetical protein